MILLDPAHGMWMLPRGEHEIECATWLDSAARFAEFRELCGDNPVVALIPRPDNTYNPQAVSIAQPITFGGDRDERDLGYVRDRDLPILGGDRFARLAAAGQGAEIGCHAAFHGDRLVLSVPTPGEMVTLTADFVRRPPDPAAARAVAAIQALPVPPARRAQAARLADAALVLLGRWSRAAPEPLDPGPLTVQQRAVFGHRAVHLVNRSGGRLGSLVDLPPLVPREKVSPVALGSLVSREEVSPVALGSLVSREEVSPVALGSPVSGKEGTPAAPESPVSGKAAAPVVVESLVSRKEGAPAAPESLVSRKVAAPVAPEPPISWEQASPVAPESLVSSKEGAPAAPEPPLSRKQAAHGVLTLHDERLRPAAVAAFAQAGIVLPPADLDGWFPDAVIEVGPDGWLIRSRADAVPLGVYQPGTGVLGIHAEPFREAATTLLRRHGVTPAVIRWQAPRPAAPRPGERDEARLRPLVDRQTTRIWSRHRALLPEPLAGLSPLFFTDEPVDPIFTDRDAGNLHEDSYYLSALDEIFGPHDHRTPSRRQKPAPCRLCGSDALEAVRHGEPGARALAYCKGCAFRVTRRFLIDEGVDQPWTPLAVWALRELTAELGGPPSRSQVPRLPSTVDAAAADRAMLVRMHVPRIAGRDARRQATGRAPLTWTDWLNRAGLLADGKPMARGTATVAADGHLCRSLLERHIDDFLTANGIAHEVEPYWPFDPELNTTGMRADWLLADGTYVEAWGAPGEAAYASKMDRKAELAARTGIRLVGVTSADLGVLHTLFARWITGPARMPHPAGADPRLRRPADPARPPAPSTPNTRNDDERAARLRRCREALALQRSGLSRAEIATRMGVGPDSLKQLLRDGKFYAEPDSDPERRLLAEAARAAQAAGMTKNAFRRAKDLTVPKANEAWRDGAALSDQ